MDPSPYAPFPTPDQAYHDSHMDFWGGGVGEGTPTRLAKGWTVMIVLTVPFAFIVVTFMLCCCRVQFFDYYRPVSKWRAERRALRVEEMRKGGFVGGGDDDDDGGNQRMVVGTDVDVDGDGEDEEPLSQRMKRLREMRAGTTRSGTEVAVPVEVDGLYSPTVHLSPGCRSPRAPSVTGSVVEHYPSMVPEIPLSTMASMNGMAAGPSYCPSEASNSVHPYSADGNGRPMHCPTTRNILHPVSPRRSMYGKTPTTPHRPANSRDNFHAIPRYPSYTNFRDSRPPSISSLQRPAYGVVGPHLRHPPNSRQAPSRRTSLLSMQEVILPSSSCSREDLQTVSEQSSSIDEQAGRTLKPTEALENYEPAHSSSGLEMRDMVKRVLPHQ
ncbi:hypothetical protein FKW77_000788 [Venturia effusa]|uniref:Uncharacterized protein n=1 Tax=Venturia effusa TaxID=50376 RepID=A0A517L2M8_9PEZI|nr:hypothetical protein FKW77_000788 [Venturia effusa]